MSSDSSRAENKSGKIIDFNRTEDVALICEAVVINRYGYMDMGSLR